MTGEELKNVLNKDGYSVTQLAKLLGCSQQNVSSKMATDSVKTGFLETLCEKLNKDLTFFYGGTKYLPSFHTESNNKQVPKFLYDEMREELKKENEQLREQLEYYKIHYMMLSKQSDIAENNEKTNKKTNVL